MNWKPTWLLLGLAAALFAFIFLVERNLSTSTTPPPRLFSFKGTEVTNIQLRITNQLMLRVERQRAETPWSFSFPISYPANPHAIQWLVQSLEQVVPRTQISQQELRAARRTIAEFGLDVPQATLTLQHQNQRTEILFGSRTPVGDGVYVQVLNQPDIYVLDSEFVTRLPRSFNDWRELRLLPLVNFNRIDIRSPGRGFVVDLEPVRKTFVLTKPTITRADPAKVGVLLQKLFTAQVSQFITDSPRADLDAYGFQPPEAEVSFLTSAVGSNEQYTAQFTVQFGKSPTNDLSSVYARRLTTTNIVLVPRSVLEAVQISHSDVRDLHLVSFAPHAVDSIEVFGTENFTVQRQTNGTWMITAPTVEPADTNSIHEWLDVLSKLEGTVEKDVVTDFSTPYGLATPTRKYLLKTSVTNSSGTVSNHVVAELDLGLVQDKKVFARRPDESTVYSLSKEEVARLPNQAWQLRDRRVWSFTTNQVGRIILQYKGQAKTLQRNANASWSLVEGQGIVDSNNPILDEMMYRLGALRANYWVAKGDENRAAFGFTDDGSKITIELRNGEKPRVLVLEFGRPGFSPSSMPYALAVADGQTWIFEFPADLFFPLIGNLFNPLFGGGG